MSDHQAVQLAVENIFSHSAMLAQEAICILRNAYDRPSAVYRPKLSIKDDKWFALYGDSEQTGCCGYGDTPDAAMWDFDKNWHSR